MSRSRVLHCCAAVWLTCAVATPFAQSIDPSGASLALHRPFSLRLPVRTGGTEAVPPQRLTSCVDAEFQSGATLLFSDQMRVTLEPSPRPGWQWLVFEHPHVVDEPALLAHIVLRCPARFEREFVMQALVGGDRSPPPAASLTAGAAPRPTERPRPRPKPKPVELNVDAAKPVAAPAVKPPDLPFIPAPAHSSDEETRQLKAEVAHLRDALATAQQAAATVQPLAVSAGESTSSPNDESPTLAGGVLLACVLAALLPGMRWWRLRIHLPKVHAMEIAQPAAAALPDPPPTARRPMPPIQVIVEGRPEQPDLIPPTPIPPGAASLADHDAARFTSQVEVLVTDGYLSVAVALLEKSLQATPARNPWLMLQLLGLYERTGEGCKGAQLIGELQTLYRVHLPTLGGVVQPGCALLDLPGLVAQVQQAWTEPDLLEVLEDLIFRDVGPAWDLATFQDLLLLHAVAAARSTLEPAPAPLVTKPFEPVLEWNTGDDH